MIILKYTAKPREIGAPEDEKVGSQRSAFISAVSALRLSPSTSRPITLQDWLLGLESLGGSKGLEDFLKENLTGIEMAVSEVEHEEKKGSFRFQVLFSFLHCLPAIRASPLVAAYC